MRTTVTFTAVFVAVVALLAALGHAIDNSWRRALAVAHGRYALADELAK
ncbi:hypothetical protein [Streptomyces sp. NBC_01431]|nr:hypothetical protein [Streptomyces sp. NBC_01431]